MLELLLLRHFYKKLAATAEDKNRSRSWGWLGVLLWFTGEVLGFVIAGVDGGGESYIAALVCAAVGALIAFGVVGSLSALAPADFPTASIHRER